MKQQTAVEWLESELNIWQTIAEEDTNATLDVIRGWIDKLKAMEKEQIQDAFYHGIDVDSWNVENPYVEAEEYYQETYGK